MEELIRMEKVTAAYGQDPVLVNVDLAVAPGAFVGIVGPSGSGKTSVLRVMTGSLRPIAGRIEKAPRLRIGYVPQVDTVNWYFPVTVREAVLMGRTGDRRLPWASREELRLAGEVLDHLGIAGVADRHIRELSGGQQQRVFVARALAQEAELYFMDEPFAGVDATTERAIIGLLQELRSAGKTVVAVHHDLNTVDDYFDDVALLNVRLVAAGPVDKVFTHENLHATYGGRIAFLADGPGGTTAVAD